MSPSRTKLSRRTLFTGAATAGALGAAATLLPQAAQQTPPALPEAKAPPERGGGYQLSEHVKTYYKTTRL